MAGYSSYPSAGEAFAQFGDGGKILYMLGLDGRSIDVLQVENGQKRRTVRQPADIVS
jgi:hypothetical protein